MTLGDMKVQDQDDIDVILGYNVLGYIDTILSYMTVEFKMV